MGKVAIITGASSGIGFATTNLLLKNGFQVMLAARRGYKLKPVVEGHPETATYAITDVSDADQVKSLVEQTIQKFGEIDVLINNAGIGYLYAFEEMSLDEMHLMTDVNVRGVLNCIHYALPYLLKSKGCIVNVSSIGGHSVLKNGTVYCSTKYAVSAISKGLSLELAGRVKVMEIAPAGVETEFLDKVNPKGLPDHLLPENPCIGLLKADDVARAILQMLNNPSNALINSLGVKPT